MKFRVYNNKFPMGIDFKEYFLFKSLGKYLGFYGHPFNAFDVYPPHLIDPPFMVSGVSSIDNPLETTSNTVIPMGGKGRDFASLYLSSMGEAFERFYSILYGFNLSLGTLDDIEQLIIHGSYKELQKLGYPCISPDELGLFHKEQYSKENIPYYKFTSSMSLGWIKGHDVIKNEEIYVPAQIVLMGYIRRKREKPIGYASSAGLVSGARNENTLLRGICEFVERDANNVYWHSRYPPYRIQLTKSLIDNTYLRDLIDWILDERISIEIYFWPTEIKSICVTSVHIINRYKNRYIFYPGIGSATCLFDSLNKALLESMQAQRFMYFVESVRCLTGKDLAFYSINENADPREADNLFKIITYYGYPKNFLKVDRYFSRANETNVDKIASAGYRIQEYERASLSEVISEFKDLGYRLIVFDFTPEEIAQDIKILKVFIPELTQYNNPRYPYLGHSRYYTFQMIMGYSSNTVKYEDLEKVTIPYP